MKTLIFIISIFAFNCAVLAQNNCPTISLTKSSKGVLINTTINFNAIVNGLDSNNLKYKWSVSAGKIISGQGTSIITVEAKENLEEGQIKATIEISGLPQDCPSIASETNIIVICILPMPKLLDEYSEIPPHIQKEKLQKIAVELASDPVSYVIISETFAVQTPNNVIKKKLADTLFYLIQSQKMDSSRIIIRVAKAGENITQIRIITAGVSPPEKEYNSLEFNAANYQQRLDELFPVSQKNSKTKKAKKK